MRARGRPAPLRLRVAATLRLADFMPDDGTGEGAVLGELAERAGADPDGSVIESHGTPGGDPAAFAEMNLHMLILAGGRERTIDNCSALAGGAGLQVAAVHGSTERHVIIECVPR